MWNKPQMYEEDDDSWEVRAFEEDTLGCTWPPRSYTCTFCKREFRSAQALGGHMNVHRRDRARLHGMSPQFSPLLPTLNVSKHPSSTPLLIPTQEFVTNGLCLLYPFPNPNPNSNSNIIVPTATLDSPTHQQPFITFSPLAANALSPGVAVSSLHQSINNEEPLGFGINTGNNFFYNETAKDSAIEELDLELRLGRRSPPP